MDPTQPSLLPKTHQYPAEPPAGLEVEDLDGVDEVEETEAHQTQGVGKHRHVDVVGEEEGEHTNGPHHRKESRHLHTDTHTICGGITYFGYDTLITQTLEWLLVSCSKLMLQKIPKSDCYHSDTFFISVSFISVISQFL